MPGRPLSKKVKSRMVPRLYAPSKGEKDAFFSWEDNHEHFTRV